MKRIISGGAVVQWVAARVGRPIELPATALGVAVDYRLIGGIVFSGYNGSDVEITVAGEPRAWTPAFLKRVGEYVWQEMDCLRVTIRTEQPRVVDLAQRLGGQIEGRMRDFYGSGRDAFVIGVLRRDWRL